MSEKYEKPIISIWKKYFYYQGNQAELSKLFTQEHSTEISNYFPKVITSNLVQNRSLLNEDKTTVAKFAELIKISGEISQEPVALFFYKNENDKTEAEAILSGSAYSPKFNLLMRVICSVAYQFLECFPDVDDSKFYRIHNISLIIHSFRSIKQQVQLDIYFIMQPVIEEMIAFIKSKDINQCAEEIKTLYEEMYKHAKIILKGDYTQKYKILLLKFLLEYANIKTNELAESCAAKSKDEVNNCLTELIEVSKIIDLRKDMYNKISPRTSQAIADMYIQIIDIPSIVYDDFIEDEFKPQKEELIMMMLQNYSTLFQFSEILKKEIKIDKMIYMMKWMIKGHSNKLPFDKAMLNEPKTLKFYKGEERNLEFSKDETFKEKLVIEEHYKQPECKFNYEMTKEEKMILSFTSTIFSKMNMTQRSEFISLMLKSLSTDNAEERDVQMHICYMLAEILENNNKESMTNLDLPWKELLESIMFSPKLNEVVSHGIDNAFLNFILLMKQKITTFFIKSALSNNEGISKELSKAIIAIREFSEKSIFNFISIIPLIHVILQTDYGKMITTFSNSIPLWKKGAEYLGILRNAHFAAQDEQKENVRILRVAILQLFKAIAFTEKSSLNIKEIVQHFIELVFENNAVDEGLIIIDHGMNSSCTSFFAVVTELIDKLISKENEAVIPITTRVFKIACSKENMSLRKLFEEFTKDPTNNMLSKITKLIADITKGQITSTNADFISEFIKLVANFGLSDAEIILYMQNTNFYKELEDILKEVDLPIQIINAMITLATGEDGDIQKPVPHIIKNAISLHLIFAASKNSKFFKGVLHFFYQCCTLSYSNCLKLSEQLIPEFLLQVICEGRKTLQEFTDAQIEAINLFEEISKKVLSHSTLSSLFQSMTRFEKVDHNNSTLFRVVQKKNPINSLLRILDHYESSKCIQKLPSFASFYSANSGFFTSTKEKLVSWSFVSRLIIDSLSNENNLIQRDIIKFEAKKEFIRVFIDNMNIWAESNTQEKILVTSLPANEFITLSVSFINGNKISIYINDNPSQEKDFLYPIINEGTTCYIFFNKNQEDKCVTNVSCFHIFPIALSEEKIKEISNLPENFTSDIESSIISINTKLIHNTTCPNHAGESKVTITGDTFQFPQTIIQSISYAGGINVLQHMLIFSSSNTLDYKNNTNENKMYAISVLTMIRKLMKYPDLQKDYFENNGIIILSHLLRKIESYSYTDEVHNQLDAIYEDIPDDKAEWKIEMLKHIYYEKALWKRLDRDKLIIKGHEKRCRISPIPYVIDIYKIVDVIYELNAEKDKVVINEILSIADVRFTQRDQDTLLNALSFVQLEEVTNQILDVLMQIHTKHKEYNNLFSDNETAARIVFLLIMKKVNNNTIAKVLKFALTAKYQLADSGFDLERFIRLFISNATHLNNESYKVISPIKKWLQEAGLVEEAVPILIPLFIFLISFSQQSNLINGLIESNIDFAVKNNETGAILAFMVLRRNTFFVDALYKVLETIYTKDPNSNALESFHYLLNVLSDNENVLQTFLVKCIGNKETSFDLLKIFCYVFFDKAKFDEEQKIINSKMLHADESFKLISDVKGFPLVPHYKNSLFELNSSTADLLNALINCLDEISNKTMSIPVKQIVAYATGVLIVRVGADGSEIFQKLIQIVAKCTWDSTLSTKTAVEEFVVGIIQSAKENGIELDEVVRLFEQEQDQNIDSYNKIKFKNDMIKKLNKNSTKESVKKELDEALKSQFEDKFNEVKDYFSNYDATFDLHPYEERNDIKNEESMQYIKERCIYKSFNVSMYQINGPWCDSDDFNLAVLPKIDAYGRMNMLGVKLDIQSKKKWVFQETMFKSTQDLKDVNKTMTGAQKEIFNYNSYYSTEDVFFKAHFSMDEEKITIIFIEDLMNDCSEYEERDIRMRDISNVFLGQADKSISFNNDMVKLNTIEIFLRNGKSYQIAFDTYDKVKKVACFIKQHVPNEVQKFIQDNDDSISFFKKFNYIDDWRNGRISTTEFLMRLNLFSGFSFRNFNRYPIFPFLYTNIQTHEKRNLSYLFNCQTEEKREHTADIGKTLTLPNGTPCFNTEYVTCALQVAIKLPAITPWQETHLRIQKGLDEKGRVITSQGMAMTSTPGECPVLWYMLPQIFENCNEISLFEDLRNEFILPSVKGCKTYSWFAFVQGNTEYLESDEISKEIHNWIDLIFGSGLNEKTRIKRFNTFTDDPKVSSPCQQIMKNDLPRRLYGRTVINTSNIKVAVNEEEISRILDLQFKNDNPVLITSTCIYTLSSQLKKNRMTINLSEDTKISHQRSTLFALVNTAIFTWEPTSCAITKTEKGLFSTTKTQGPEDNFAITNKLYNHEGEVLIIRNDCSVEKIDQNMNRIFFKTQEIGKCVSSDLSIPLKLLAICTNNVAVVLDPYNGQPLSRFALIKEKPLMIKLLETPVIAVAYSDEIIIQRMDLPKKLPDNVIRQEKYLCIFKSSEKITNICPIDMVGTPSDLLVFTDKKMAYLIHPTNYLNEDVIIKDLKEAAEISIPTEIVVNNSIYHRKKSVVYAANDYDVIAINIGAAPKKLN